MKIILKPMVLSLLIILFSLFAIVFNYLGLASFLSTKEGSFNFKKVTRKYRIHLPRSSDKKPVPLVIVLHAYSDYPKQVELYTGWSKKADKEGFAVLYPEGTNSNKDKKRAWNAGSCCGAPYHAQTEDVEFIKQLLAYIKTHYSIEDTRIYVTGFSNGALLTHRLGAELSHQFAALAPVAGSIGGGVENDTHFQIKTPTTAIPIIMFHGKEDISIPYDGGINKLKDAHFLSVKDTTHFWVKNNHCSENAHQVEENNVYLKDSYSCPQHKDVVLYSIFNNNHVWFGGVQDLILHPFQKKINATDLIWEFFKDKSL